MGLDGVEIVVKVENAFGIAIRDSEASKTVTPGQLIDLILSKVNQTADDGCLTQKAFHRFRRSLMSQFSIQRSQVKPETLLKDIFPRSTRKQDVQQVWRDLGLTRDLEFNRPFWLMAVVLPVIICGGVCFAFLVASYSLASQNASFTALMTMMAITTFVYGALRLALRVTRPLEIEFAPTVATVEQLSRWIVANAPGCDRNKSRQWSRQQISEMVRQIVIEVLPCENEYREDAHFVYDLGMS